MLNHNWESRSGFLHNLVSTRINLAPVRDIVGQNILAWQTHFFTKLPYEATPVAWHQDASYWPLTPSRAVTAWIAIDATDNENGAMSVIPGSHLYGQLPYISGEAGKTSSVYQTAWKPECYGDSVQLSLAPGEMSLHSDLLLHASGPNLSSRSRCGLVIRFIPPSVRNVRKPGGDSAILCSGTSEDRYWKIRTQPVLR
ncbi:phytanoyl-CoA dioxygenase family protein [Neorhizobium galegae]|uniref:phytanoyl-CoA dioxygenase family protein n=1 Tax=Neorhizobium galegae TaxID=399 RepID=UPI003D79E858